MTVRRRGSRDRPKADDGMCEAEKCAEKCYSECSECGDENGRRCPPELTIQPIERRIDGIILATIPSVSDLDAITPAHFFRSPMKYLPLSLRKLGFPIQSVRAARCRVVFLALLASQIQAGDLRAAETLYNGIELPSPWPPHVNDFPTSVEKDPVVPPYLVSPPKEISIDVGRQLFVDDFLISETTLARTFHLPKYHSASPVVKPDQPWEMKNPDHAAAMVFSDGVWYDPSDRLFKMWYLGGESASTGYAVSKDGIHWDKPSLDVRPGTNIVQPGGRDSSTVWLDLEEKDPARRFKMWRVIGVGEDPVTGWNNWAMEIHFSPDGIHWGEPVARSGRMVDRSTVFWNPFRKVWVYSIRHAYKTGAPLDRAYGFYRKRSYVEGSDVLEAARWEVNEPLRWTDVDRLDPQREDLKIKPQLYNLDAVAYESLMVGFFTIWRGQPENRHKPNNVVLGYSRDGWHWSRPDRRAFCPVSDNQGDWNANNVQSAGGGFLVVGDELYFYVSGRTGRPGNNKAGTLSTGLATLRRDGFASMDAKDEQGALTTRPCALVANISSSMSTILKVNCVWKSWMKLERSCRASR
jgi:hypothetical protein